jgi:hypothetical protein
MFSVGRWALWIGCQPFGLEFQDAGFGRDGVACRNAQPTVVSEQEGGARPDHMGNDGRCLQGPQNAMRYHSTICNDTAGMR